MADNNNNFRLILSILLTSPPRNFKRHEAVALIEDDTYNIRSADIFLQPPGDGTNSDEDSGDEDHSVVSYADVDIELLSGEAVTIRSDGNIPEDDSIETVLEDGLTVLHTKCPSTMAESHIPKNLGCQRLWEEPTPEFLLEAHSPSTIFEWFFDEDIVSLIVTETNKYTSWIPDVGDGSVLKEPLRNLANDADLARVRVVARNTIERVARAANHGFEKRVLQYNNVVENNRWGNYVNWKLYPLFGLMEHRKVSIGLPYKVHLQREINDDKIFFGENGSDAKLEKTNLQVFIPVITPSIEVETRIFNSLTKDIEIAFLHRNMVVRDDIDLERIDTNVKKGGFIFSIPLIFAGLTAAGAIAGGTAAGVSFANEKKAAEVTAAEEHRYNLEREKQAKIAATAKNAADAKNVQEWEI
ncbi:hypothetical protein LOTGIDRAFT_160088 [Lottia gigantea]|uniref:Uncharacterized protein n=1 Tax=Lottia gigantea TaxID=225164 RepID=V3ZX48_LOTGI|nr:hypothetical protein LOTGIDRAFT_160088 [Lottia gigantea]ESO96103.1 hypothetical protein LOTGIDRAFT_160088 [Lottia gigantea]